MTKFWIECDGNRTKIWIGNEEISKTVEKIAFEQREDSPPRVNLTFYPIDFDSFAYTSRGDKDG